MCVATRKLEPVRLFPACITQPVHFRSIVPHTEACVLASKNVEMLNFYLRFSYFALMVSCVAANEAHNELVDFAAA